MSSFSACSYFLFLTQLFNKVKINACFVFFQINDPNTAERHHEECVQQDSCYQVLALMRFHLSKSIYDYNYHQS